MSLVDYLITTLIRYYVNNKMFEQLNVLGGPYERFQCFCWVRISMKLFLNIECYLYEVIFEKIGVFLD